MFMNNSGVQFFIAKLTKSEHRVLASNYENLSTLNRNNYYNVFINSDIIEGAFLKLTFDYRPNQVFFEKVKDFDETKKDSALINEVKLFRFEYMH